VILRPRDRPSTVRPALLISGAATVAFLLLTLAVLRHAGPVLRVDALLAAEAHRTALRHPLWRSVMAAITVTGSTAVITPVAAVGCLVLVWRSAWPRACFVAVALTVTLLIRLLIVNAVGRPRPPGPLAPATGWAFPSGHAAASAATALIAVLVCWPLLTSGRSRLLLATVASTWAAAVAVSRVALVVHWPSDVLGSWLLVLAIIPAIAVLWQSVFGAPITARGG
jgi:membrane-associated phospholipid phosphatase